MHPVFHFLDLDGTIFNLIQPKINKNRRDFHRFLKFLLFFLLYDLRILVQIYQSIIWFDQAWLTLKAAAQMLSRRYQNSQKREITQNSNERAKISEMKAKMKEPKYQGIRSKNYFKKRSKSYSGPQVSRQNKKVKTKIKEPRQNKTPTAK